MGDPAETRTSPDGHDSGDSNAETLQLPDDPLKQAAAYNETVVAEDSSAATETVSLPGGENVAANDPELTSRLRSVIAEGDEALEIAEALRDSKKRLGRYVVLRELGKGGMGVVLKAFDPRLCRLVAIKQILGEVDRQSALRFAREARLTAQLSHPSIAPVYEGVASGKGTPYLVMEFVRGKALSEVARGTPMQPRRAAEVLAPIADAIHYAHGKGIVHRDLKPHNIMVSEKGPPVVLDFGLARRENSESIKLTRTGGVLGTPAYMAPEQAAGVDDVGPLADVYGLGATLYECLTGRPPFTGPSTMAVLRSLQDEEAKPPRERNPLVPRALETICLTCLEKDPQRRYPDAAALAADLRRFLAGEPIDARRAPTAVRMLRRAWRRRSLTLPLAVGFLIAAAAIPALLGSEREQAAKELQATQAKLDKELLAAEAKLNDEREAKAESDRQRTVLQEALGLVEQLNTARRYRYQPLLPPEEEAKLLTGARTQIASVVSRLDATLSKAPELADLHVLRGRAALQLLDLPTAKRCAQTAIERDDANASAWLLLAETQIARLALEFLRPTTPMEDKRAWAAAGRDAFAKAQERGSEAPAVAKAWHHLLASEHEAARAILDQADTGLPNEEVQFARAILESQLHGSDLAVVASYVTPELNKALRLCPRMVPALYARGVSHRAARDLEAAAADFRATVRLQPDLALAHYDLGQTLSDLGRAVESQAAMQRAIDLEPKNASAWNGLGFAKLLQGRLDAAIAALDRSIALEPTAVAHVNRGSARSRKGDLPGTIADCTSALAIDPNYVGALNNRAMAKAASGDVAGALADLSLSIERDPSYVNAYVNRAKFRLESQNVAGALADARQAIKVQPTLPDAWWWSALAKAMSNDTAGGIQDLDEAIRLNPNYLLAYDLRGSIKKMSGDVRGCALDVEQCLRLAPGQPGAAAKRAFVARTLGRPSRH